MTEPLPKRLSERDLAEALASFHTSQEDWQCRATEAQSKVAEAYACLLRIAGRPKGSTGFLQNARALGLNHFAFLRASLLRTTLAEVFARYLSWPEVVQGKL